ncbi:MAG: hypothetical protein M3076_10845 [Actinomycetota bacterium]|nr:hypothetical protein [Actinomycetota bacterium]
MTAPTQSSAPEHAVADHRVGPDGTRTPVARWIAALEACPRQRLVLIVWGITVAVLGGVALYVSSPAHWPIMPSRSTGLRDSLAMLKQGGPLLAGHHGGVGPLYPVGAGDDVGIYLYLPWLAHVLGVSDPVTLVRDGFAVMFAVAAAFYPMTLWRLTGSMLAALAAPVVMLLAVRSLGFTDIYWLPAWASLALLPPLLVLSERHGRYSWIGLVLIALAAGWLNTMRSSSGVGVAIAALVVLLMLRLRWRRTLSVLAVMVLAYISIGTFALTAIRDHRDHRLGAALSANHPQSHPFWHPAYLGLGYLPNNYHIRFLDRIAQERVQSDAPGTAYLSNKYESALRKAYFGIVRDHPFEVLGQYAAKAWVTLADTAPYLLIVILTLPALRRLRVKRRLTRWLALLIPSLLVTFVPTLVAIPLGVYEEGLYGTVGLMAIIGIGFTIAEFSAALQATGALRPALASAIRGGAEPSGPPAGPGPRARGAARAVALSVVALLVLTVSAHFIRRDAEQWQHSSSGVLIDRIPAGPTRA